ncbi:hypothetical protein [Pedobacter glucosidilyticus]|uniref:hypothetical protein n=1 Tax=Pedobacter glucosidilyticus TaxID=1122941 RepID=UPI0004078D0C|nr:hypothetical protein [Pedobacter glucosidilyticus]
MELLKKCNYKKATFFLLVASIIFACSSNQKTNPVAKIDTIDSTDSISTEQTDESYNDFETYHIVIIDTSSSYYKLQEVMFSVNKFTRIPIDTLDRYYNNFKKQIVLPENHQDEMYAGSYYPRRYPTVFLSIEYLNFYKKEADSSTFALVAGIHEREKSADSLLSILKKVNKKAFKLKSEVYTGCLH